MDIYLATSQCSQHKILQCIWTAVNAALFPTAVIHWSRNNESIKVYSFCRWPTLKPKQMRGYSTDLVQKGSVWRVKLIIEVKKITIYFFCVWMRSMIYVMFQLLEKVIFIFHLESIVRLIVSLNRLMMIKETQK